MRNQDPVRGEAAVSAATGIVLVIPSNLKHLAPPIQKLIGAVKQQANGLRDNGRAVDYAAVECAYAEQVAAIESAAHQCTLEALAIDRREIEVRGQAYVRVAEGNGTYFER